MQTRKHPRTMQEAFGPYTSRDLLEKHEPHFDWQDALVMAGCTLTAVASAVILCFWG